MSEVKDDKSLKMTLRASTRAGFKSSTTTGIKASTTTGLRATGVAAGVRAPALMHEPYDPDQ